MPDSQKPVRAAFATAEGKHTGMPMSFAKEVISKIHGRKAASMPESGEKRHPLARLRGPELRPPKIINFK